MLNRRLRLMPVVVLVLMAAGGVGARPADGQVEALLEQLSSPDAAIREAATQRLIEMGEEAREALETHIRSRNAALDALNQIEADRATSPTLITLDLTNVTVDEALAALFEQCGFVIPPQHEQSWQQAGFARVSITCENAPFWDVLREMAMQAGFTVQNIGSGGLVLTPHQGGRNVLLFPAVQSGSFLVIVTSLQRTNSVNLSEPQTVSRNVSMQLQVFAEPKVRVLRAASSPQLEEVVDDKGNSLVPDRPTGRSYSGPGSGAAVAAWSMSIPLVYPDEPGSRIASLKGSVPVMIQTRHERIEFDIGAAAGTSQTAGARRVELLDVTQPNDSTWLLNVTIHSTGTDTQEIYALLRQPDAVLLDAQGRAWQFSGIQSMSTGANQASGRLTFTRRGGAAGPPVKFRWDMPVASQEISIPFEFQDLPLP